MRLAPYSQPLLELRNRGLVPRYLKVFLGAHMAPAAFPVGSAILVPLDADLATIDLRVAAGLDVVIRFDQRHEQFAQAVVDLLKLRYGAARVLCLPQAGIS